MDWSPIAAAGVRTAGDLLGVALSDSGPTLHDQYKKALKYQKNIRKKGPAWSAQGARKAGLHPLAALGMMPTGGPSVSAGTTNAKAKMASQMGQNIGDALDRQADPLDKEAKKLRNEQMRLEIMKGYSELASQKDAMSQFSPTERNYIPQTVKTSAGTPINNKMTRGLVEVVPTEQKTVNPNAPSQTAGLHAGDTLYRKGSFLVVAPSEKYAESMESPTAMVSDVLRGIAQGIYSMSNWDREVAYAKRNYPVDQNPGPGRQWQWIPIARLWRPVYAGSKLVPFSKVYRRKH